MTRLAPNVRLDIVPWRGPAIFHAEFARTIDLVISIGDAFKGFHRQLIYSDRDALAVRRGRPGDEAFGRRDAFLSARHVAVVIRGQSSDLIDDWLRTKGPPPLDAGIDEQFMFYPTRARSTRRRSGCES